MLLHSRQAPSSNFVPTSSDEKKRRFGSGAFISKELRLVVTLKQLLGPVAQILIQAGVHVKPFGLYKGGCALCGVLQCQNMLSKKQMQEPKRRPSRDSRSQESANPSRTESNRQLQGWAHGGARWSRKKLRAAKQQQIRWRRWGCCEAVSRQLRATPAVPSYHALLSRL